MSIIKVEKIQEALRSLLVQANENLPQCVYEKLFNAYKNEKKTFSKAQLVNILENAYLAQQNQRPLCQDTGQVIVFLKIGQNVFLEGANLIDSINEVVSEVYSENYYRKSVVKNAYFDRENTTTNTPAIVYTEIVDGYDIKLDILIKGGGAENMSKLFMLTPFASEQEIMDCVELAVRQSGMSSCPPLFLGIGIGGTSEKALLLSKQAFFEADTDEQTVLFADKIKNYVNSKNNTNFSSAVLDIKIKTTSTHIACLPLGITFNCHCMRHASAIISENEIKELDIKFKIPEFEMTEDTASEAFKLKINSGDIDKIRMLKKGDKILLSGVVYTARDAAHQRIFNFPDLFDLKDKIIFYAGPCPPTDKEIIGPIGPTTSKRMDKFSSFVTSQNMLAAIGKGERSDDTITLYKNAGVKYFTLLGGIPNVVQKCVKAAEIVAFENLGAEAIYKLSVENLPLSVEF